MQRYLFYSVLFVYLGFCSVVHAQVEHAASFKATETVSVEAVPAADLDERRARFTERNAPAALKDLADELFGMMRLDWRPDSEEAAQRYTQAVEAYRAGRYAEALDGYKMFFMQRVLDADDKGRDPATRRFVVFFTEADGLMRGRARMAALTEDYPDSILHQHNPVDTMLSYFNAGMLDDKHIFLDVGIGEPGEVNWITPLEGYYGPTWHTARDERFFATSVGGAPDFFGSLLAEYVETADPAYLLRWAAYTDDFTLNFIRDLQTTPWADQLNWSSFYAPPPMDSLVFTLRAHPEAVDILPSATLVRMVLDNWKTALPRTVQLTRSGGGNRRVHLYANHLNILYDSYPELAERNYLMQKRRRSLEDHVRKGVLPDGTDGEYGLPYYTLYFTVPHSIAKRYEDDPDVSWASPHWYDEIRRTQELVGSYVMRSLDPIGHQPGHRHALRNILRTTRLLQLVEANLPDMLERPEHHGHWQWLKGNHEVVGTSPRAYSFPYGGQYFAWSDWSEHPQFMHLTAAPEGHRNRWRFNNNLWLTAYGQLMLFFGADDYVLEVDGVGGMAGGRVTGFPSLTPQPHRFHASGHFNLMEAQYTDDSRMRPDIESGQGGVVDPMKQYPGWYPPTAEQIAAGRLGAIDHHRQVLFVRDAGVWVVVDRVAGEREHEFRFLWPFRGDYEFRTGSLDLRNNVRQAPEDSYLKGYRPTEDFEIDEQRAIIRTVNPHIPNLTIYHAADKPLRLPSGDFVQHDWRLANALGMGPVIENAQQAVMASALFPRRELDDELKSFAPVSVEEGTGYDLETADGARVSVRAAGATPTTLTAGPVILKGETLLLAQNSGNAAMRGVALGIDALEVHGVKQKVPGPDVEFEIGPDGAVAFERIYYPLDMVTIEPAADRFVDQVKVTMSHPEPGVEIRYTLDGTQPDLSSPLYEGPVTLSDSAWVTAMAVRPGVETVTDLPDSTHHSIRHWAVYEKEPMREPAFATRPQGLQPGLTAHYVYSDYPLSMFNLAALPATKRGTASGLFDIDMHDREARPSNYGFIYSGYLEIPKDGVYSIHTPEVYAASVDHQWYDIRVRLNDELWYPATRRQNFGTWSVPLKAGLHKLKVEFVDQRPSVGLRGEAHQTIPQLDWSGPDLPRQPIPTQQYFRMTK